MSEDMVPCISTPDSGWKVLRCIDRYHIFLIIITTIFFFISSLMVLFRLSIFDPHADTVIFNQAFWNTIHHGELLYNSPEMHSHFAVHFSPILLSIVPVYLLVPSPETLLILQTALISLGVIPVYLCSREFLGPKTASLISIIYFLYPHVQGVAYVDFYETSFFPIIFGFAIWGFLTKREDLMLICCCATLLIKEDICLIVLMMALIGIYQYRFRTLQENWRFILLITLSIVILVSFFLIIKPAFSDWDPHSANQFLDQYRDISYNFSNQNDIRINYLIQTFFPLLLVPLATPSILAISIPPFVEILASPHSMMFSVGQHYSAMVIPIVFMSLIAGLNRMKQSGLQIINRISVILPYLIVITSILSTILWSPWIPPLQYAAEGKHLSTWNHGPVLHDVMDIIPSDVPLAAPMNILPFLTDRHDLNMGYVPTAEIILYDTHLPEYADDFLKNSDQINKDYSLIIEKEGISLFVRNDKSALIEDLKQKTQTI